MESEWYQVGTSDQDFGWVYGHFVAVDADLSEIPVSEETYWAAPPDLPSGPPISVDVEGPGLLPAIVVNSATLYDPDLNSRDEDSTVELPEHSLIFIERSSIYDSSLVQGTSVLWRVGAGTMAEGQLIDSEDVLVFPVRIESGVRQGDGNLIDFRSTPDADASILENSTTIVPSLITDGRVIDGQLWFLVAADRLTPWSGDSLEFGWVPAAGIEINVQDSRAFVNFELTLGFQIPSNPEELRNNWGEPWAVHVADIQNVITEQMDRTITFTYPTVRIQYYEVIATGRYLVRYVAMSGNRFPVDNRVRVGSSVSRVIGTLDSRKFEIGEVVDGTKFIYTDPTGFTSYTFTVENNSIARIFIAYNV